MFWCMMFWVYAFLPWGCWKVCPLRLPWLGEVSPPLCPLCVVRGTLKVFSIGKPCYSPLNPSSTRHSLVFACSNSDIFLLCWTPAGLPWSQILSMDKISRHRRSLSTWYSCRWWLPTSFMVKRSPEKHLRVRNIVHWISVKWAGETEKCHYLTWLVLFSYFNKPN